MFASGGFKNNDISETEPIPEIKEGLNLASLWNVAVLEAPDKAACPKGFHWTFLPQKPQDLFPCILLHPYI